MATDSWDTDSPIIIDSPEHEQIVLDLAKKWGVTNEEVLIRVLREALQAQGIERA